ncbi:MAG TPA: methyltransferase [Kineosporiaceae bacterium]|nr:methyltransferase [Kineosporiaceae bacterium]
MVDDPLRSRRWALRADPRTAVRTAVVWDALDTLIAQQVAATGRTELDVVDLGGGTGGFAVPLAALGHRVTVVDPSPDALAALQRRAAEAGVAAQVRAQQGDAAALADVVPAGGADLVLCHGVLEYVDEPAVAARAALTALRPGGVLSLLVAQRLGAVLAKALSGRFEDARRLFDGSGAGSTAGDPMPRRFDRDSLLALLAGRSATVQLEHGVRLVSDLLPGALVDGDPDAAQALLAFERAASGHPQLAALASHLHLVVQRGADDPDGG